MSFGPVLLINTSYSRRVQSTDRLFWVLLLHPGILRHKGTLSGLRPHPQNPSCKSNVRNELNGCRCSWSLRLEGILSSHNRPHWAFQRMLVFQVCPCYTLFGYTSSHLPKVKTVVCPVSSWRQGLVTLCNSVSLGALQSQLYYGLKKKYCYFIYYLLVALYIPRKILSLLFRKYCEINTERDS